MTFLGIGFSAVTPSGGEHTQRRFDREPPRVHARVCHSSSSLHDERSTYWLSTPLGMKFNGTYAVS